MRNIYKICIFFTLLLSTITIYAQDTKVIGTVTDEGGSTIPGVSVIEKGTSNGVSTDDNGKFTLNVKNGATLVFSFIGFIEQELTVRNSDALKVTLKEAAMGLDEVIVVGYGTQSKATVTSSITKIDKDALTNIPISTIGEGLKGKVSGARIFTDNNTPGADAIFRIRGGSSINKSNDPLVLVDGVERSFSGINPNDISSIEVLKDAASTAIYGSRASNGVVLITTKKGKSGKPRITFDANMAYQEPQTRIDFMNAENYINTVRPAVAKGPNAKYNSMSGYSASSGNDNNSIYSTRYLKTDESVPAGYQSMPDPLDPSKTLIFQDNNYQDLMYSSALWQNYYLGVDGGSEAVKYAVSAGYTDDGGVARGTGYKRYGARSNVDIKLNEKLSFDANFDYSKTLSNEYDNQMNVISRGLATPPTQKIYYEDGTPTPGYNATSPNPIWYDATRDQENSYSHLSMTGEFTYKIFKDLKANAQLSRYSRVYESEYAEKAHKFSGLRTTKAGFSDLERTKLDSYLTYTKSFAAKHNVSAMAGYSYQVTNFKSMDATVTGASSDKVPTLTAGPTKTAADSKIEKTVLIGYFGRFSYDYNKKYMLSATFRYDGSSLFAKNNQWGFFPGVSGGWTISREPFMQGIKQIDNLKLRVSYGQTGNNSIGLYDALGKYSSDAKYDGIAGIIPSTMPNANLTWETSTQTDIGLDLGILNNRVSLSVDYFNKRTDDLLFSKELPNTSGFSNVQTNIGSVKFYGFDFEISTSNIKGKNFTWDSKLTWSFVKNKVLSLPDNGRKNNRIGGYILADGTEFGGTAEGEPLFRYYGYNTEKILQNQSEADAARYDNSAKGWRYDDKKNVKGRKDVGDYEWRDLDGDGKITNLDMYELGVTVPHTTGGLSNSFTYKNWGLNVYLDWALGHSINHTTYMRYFMNTFANNYALVDEVLDCWTQPGDDSKYARFTANDPDDGNGNFSRTSNVFNYKGDYLCVREVSLQYNVPESVLKKLKVEGITLVVSGNNLHYFSALGNNKGISPEVGASTTYGGGYFNYPPVRRLSFGIKLTF